MECGHGPLQETVERSACQLLPELEKTMGYNAKVLAKNTMVDL